MSKLVTEALLDKIDKQQQEIKALREKIKVLQKQIKVLQEAKTK